MNAVLNWLWQGCVVAIASCAMLRVLERARANVRYMVCWAALLLVVALPLLPSLSSTPSPTRGFPLPSGDVTVSLPDSWWMSPFVMIAAWMVWAGIGMIRFVSAMAALRRARTGSQPFPAQVESALAQWTRFRFANRRATLVLSDSVMAASVFAGGPPMIAVAPSVLDTLAASELDRVLIHEWAHVQRRDDIGHLLQILIGIVAGWHPAVWWLGRRLHIEREVACDEITVAITGAPKSYAECLIKLAGFKAPACAVHAAPAVYTASTLRARVTKIVSPRRWIAPIWSRSIAVGIVSILCVTAAGVGGLEIFEATVIALPVAPLRVVSTATDRQATAPVTRVAGPRDTERRRRSTVAPASPPQRAQATAAAPAALSSASSSPSRSSDSSPLSLPYPPRPAPNAQSPPAPADAPGSSSPRAEDRESRSGALETSVVPQAPAAPPTEVTTVAPKSPWSAAADGGTAIGRKSKQAGVATAGFFTRFGRRVAGSY